MIRGAWLACVVMASLLVGTNALNATEPVSGVKPLPNLRQFSRKLFPYHEQRAWGYMDSSGKSVLAPAYQTPGNFYDDYAVTEKDEVFGILSTAGELVVVTGFDHVDRVSNGRSRVTKRQDKLTVLKGNHQKFTFVGLDGRRISDEWYDDAGDFSEGLARVNHGAKGYRGRLEGGHWGYIDTNGKQIIPLQFELAGDFYEGVARVRVKGKWGYIDRNGKLVIQPNYEYARDFSEGLAPVESAPRAPGPAFHYIDKLGVTRIPGPFALGYEFSEERAAVTDSSDPAAEMYYIDRAGKVMIKMDLEIADKFSDGLARVFKKDQWGYIDTQGKWVIEPQYQEADNFVGGLARTLRPGSRYLEKEHYINKQNETVGKN